MTNRKNPPLPAWRTPRLPATLRPSSCPAPPPSSAAADPRTARRQRRWRRAGWIAAALLVLNLCLSFVCFASDAWIIGVARLGGLDTVPGYPVAEVSRCGRWASVRMIDPVTDELSRMRMAMRIPIPPYVFAREGFPRVERESHREDGLGISATFLPSPHGLFSLTTEACLWSVKRGWDEDPAPKVVYLEVTVGDRVTCRRKLTLSPAESAHGFVHLPMGAKLRIRVDDTLLEW
ncbi:MAG: hypothetical protein IJC43_08725 [Clostridia bacterium]|nr:hypothetical protein [Clostridia bacterium]